jgi:cell division protein FtsB
MVGGIVAYRHGFTRTANEVQERVINALQSEIQALHDRIAALEKENTRLSYTLTTMCKALKQRGIHVTIDGDIVSIQDRFGTSYTYNTRIHGMQEEQL